MPADRAVIMRVVARRAVRSVVVWGVLFGVYVVGSVSGYAATYKTIASRTRLATALGSNIGVRALIGPARRIDTVAGFASWRCLGVLSLVGAVWALLAATRLLRGEEEAGRWELLLAGRTTRRQATAQGLAGLLAGWVTLVAITAAMTVADGRSVHPPFSVNASLFFSLALGASAAVFLAVGALTSQLAATRRQAAALAAGALGVAYMIRMVADSTASMRWARWVSPLGWIQELHPLTGSRPVLLVPLGVLVAGLCLLAVHFAGLRDAGASVLRDRDTAAARTRLLAGPTGLATRLVRPVAVGWLVAMAFGGLLFGLVAQSAANAVSGNATVQRALTRLGGRSGGAAAYLGLTFIIVATLVALIAAGQVAAARAEEAEGRVENLFVRPCSRSAWLAGRLVVGAAVVLACGLVAGLAAWAGTATQHSGLAFTSLVEAGINTAPPALFLLGLGTLVHATAPRLTSAAAYGLIGWSFLVEFIGSAIKLSHWLLDTSVLYHVAPAPAASPQWASAGVLAGLGLAGAVVGGAVFNRRDLVGA